MKVLIHPSFPHDQRKFEAQYAEISEGLKDRFRSEIADALEAIEAAPTRAGHLVDDDSKIPIEFRRRNLRVFPFFVLYAWNEGLLFFGSIVPVRSDPLTWLTRFGEDARQKEPPVVGFATEEDILRTNARLLRVHEDALGKLAK